MMNAKTVANTVIQQFGGNMALSMIGAKSITYGESSGTPTDIPSGNNGDVYVDIKYVAKAKKIEGKSPNNLRIIYDVSMDTYSMVFFRLHGGKVSVLKNYDMVYCDQLQELFEGTTGLFLRL